MSVDRGNRWRDRERNDTHYAQNHMCERGGKGEEQRACGGRGGILTDSDRTCWKERFKKN